LFQPQGLVVDTVHDELVVANPNSGSITVYARTASGNVAPLRMIQGAATGFGGPRGVVVDLVHDELVVADLSSVKVFARTASGNVAPLRTLQGPATGLFDSVGVYVDLVHDELVVTTDPSGIFSVTVYPRTASGNVAPLRTLQGPATGLFIPRGVVVDLVHDELVVANGASSGGSGQGSVTVFARTASGNVAPLRTLQGPATGLGFLFGVVVDLVHDELIVTNVSFPGAVTVFARTASGNVAPLRTIAGSATALSGPTVTALTTSPPLFGAVLPTSRSVQVGTLATAFAAIINAGPGPAQACAPTPRTSVPATYFFQQTDVNNLPIGAINEPANIPAGATQHYVFAFTPTAPFAPTDVQLGFACESVNRAAVITGLNTLLLSASATPEPDVIAIGSTLGNNGIVDVPGNGTGTGLFAVATSNVGVTGSITASADTGGVVLGVTLTVCETNPGTGACLTPPTPTVTVTYAGGTNRSFAVFAQGTGPIPFDPATNRVSVRLRDGGGVTRGSTSVAIRSVP